MHNMFLVRKINRNFLKWQQKAEKEQYVGLKFIKNIDNNGLQSIVKDSYYVFGGACIPVCRNRGQKVLRVLHDSFEVGSLSELRIHISARLEVSQHQ